MSLASCIKSIGSFGSEDIELLEPAYDKFIEKGFSDEEASQKAAEEYLVELNKELNALKKQVKIKVSKVEAAPLEVDQANIELIEKIKASSEYKEYISAQDKIATLQKDGEIDQSTRISETLSWFLTAYVDIAKNPYITRGNHNDITSNAVFMMVRAGVPLGWINRFVGQESIIQYANLEMNKESKFNPSTKNSHITVINEMKAKLKAIKVMNEVDFHKYYSTLDTSLDNIEELGDFIRKDKSFNGTVMENQIKVSKELDDSDPSKAEYFENQIKYLTAFREYNRLGRKFNNTVLYSKADVNGASSNIADLLSYKKGYEEMFTATNGSMAPLWVGLSAKFSKTFLGAKHTNSVDVADKVYEKEFVTASNSFGKQILNDFYDKNNGSKGFKKNLAHIEASMYGYIASKSSFFNMDKGDFDGMFQGNNTIQKRVLEARKKYPENILLETLVPFTQDDFKFISIGNLTNKPNAFKDDLMRGWDELQEIDTELSEDLLRYSYATSNFSFNSQSFFEYAPHSLVKSVLEGTVGFFKQEKISIDYRTDFFETYYKNNITKVPKYEQKEAGQLNGYSIIGAGKYGNNIIIGDDTPGHSFIKSEEGTLYKMIEQIGEKRFMYQKTNKLGYVRKGYYIYENNLTGASVNPQNNFVNTEEVQKAVNDEIELVKTFKTDFISDVIPVNEIAYNFSNKSQLERGNENGIFNCN